LSQVFSGAYETRSQRLASFATAFGPMNDHERFILQREPGRQEAQRLGIIDFDGPGRIELYLPAGIGNGLEREGRSEPIVLPFLVGKDANVEKAHRDDAFGRRLQQFELTLDARRAVVVTHTVSMRRRLSSRATIAAGTSPPRVMHTIAWNGPTSPSRHASARASRWNASQETGNAFLGCGCGMEKPFGAPQPSGVRAPCTVTGRRILHQQQGVDGSLTDFLR